MATINKLGAKSYLASSKNVNRVLTQLNGVLASGNITVQNVNAVAGSTVTISLAAGNFINISIPAGSKSSIAFTDIYPGIYYLVFTNASSGTISASPVYAANAVKSPSITFSWIRLNTLHKSFPSSSLRVGLINSL